MTQGQEPQGQELQGQEPQAVTTWINGAVVDSSAACVSVHDEGLLRGWGVFETMLAVDGRIPLWADHWRRLQRGAQLTGIALPSPVPLQLAWEETLAASQSAAGIAGPASTPTEAGERFVQDHGGQGRPLDRSPRHQRVRLTVTAGTGSEPGGGPRATVLVTVQSCPGWTPWAQQAGQSLVTYPHPLEPPVALRGCKSTSYLPWLLAGRYAAQAGCDDALLLNLAGEVVETSRRNVFVWSAGRLWTPPLSSGCLPGVMRQQVIQIAENMGLAVRQEPLPTSELRAGLAIFLTSATSGMQSVRRLDGRNWPPGPAEPLAVLDQALRVAVLGV
jgi:branched-chain amino acid aminotransferase